ncbi:hypothetical protein [Xenorhabdus griffiniae]|uniref:Guanylate cyclase domain-containing protein n=1 Tax=Xenorhabdus griffiniae TaxID=351672 RepID=A0ABY9XJ08_9GAMM|nr:hypothetical protein [Xenorhabdus griffiniae]MBD1226823.1 hypothetical protein [Xenorhabdus griffiniae]MBE8586828.1 hypothetical protein [Xenorhabdus griffiniae]WMV72922.1 hypothetical protein QL128_02355 [Xenorhabdus griffiniae]WNH02601.1 hypothetical protein QL112_002360 [Xenorhabdus griffiniae]
MKEKNKIIQHHFDNDLIKLINFNLDCAEKEWQQVRHKLNKNETNISMDWINNNFHQHVDSNNNVITTELNSEYSHKDSVKPVPEKEMVQTFIPGYPVLENNKPEVDEFVVFMMDMRNSSSSFKQRPTATIECGLQRIFYETSALIPAVVYTAAQESGKMTELLGDGALILFHIKPNNRVNIINKAYMAGKQCINNTINHVNAILWDRYNLPPLKIGIGLAYGTAIVKVININGHHPKVIGQCVWEATKLSHGENTIGLSEEIQKILNLNKSC